MVIAFQGLSEQREGSLTRDVLLFSNFRGSGQFDNRTSPGAHQPFFRRPYTGYGRPYHFYNRWHWNQPLESEDLLTRFHYVDESEKPDNLAPPGDEFEQVSHIRVILQNLNPTCFFYKSWCDDNYNIPSCRNKSGQNFKPTSKLGKRLWENWNCGVTWQTVCGWVAEWTSIFPQFIIAYVILLRT